MQNTGLNTSAINSIENRFNAAVDTANARRILNVLYNPFREPTPSCGREQKTKTLLRVGGEAF